MGDTTEEVKVLEALLLKQKPDNGDGDGAKSKVEPIPLVRFPYQAIKGAAGRRRIIGGDVSLAMWEKGEFFGKCKVYNIESWKDPRRPIFESQADYLKRHGRAIRFKK